MLAGMYHVWPLECFERILCVSLKVKCVSAQLYHLCLPACDACLNVSCALADIMLRASCTRWNVGCAAFGIGHAF